MRPGAALAVVALGSAACAFVVSQPPSPLAAAERLLRSVAFHWVPVTGAPDSPVAVVAVSERTLANYPYLSPIDRGLLADIVDRLAGAGAAAIGLDFVFDRPTEPDKDDRIARAIRRTDVPVVVISIAPETPLAPEARAFLNAFLSGVRSGDANLPKDVFDDVVRSYRPLHDETGRPSFAAELAVAGGSRVPLRPFPLRWPPPAHGIPLYPAESLALLPNSWLNGKTVLVGSAIPGIDEYRTLSSSFGRPTYGVEIHAQALSQMLQGLDRPDNWPWAELLPNLGLAGAGAVLALALGGYAVVAVLAVLCVLYEAVTLSLYAMGQPVLPSFGPVVAATIAAVTVRAWHGRTDRRDRLALRQLFSRFLSESVVEEILRSRDLILSGGRPRPRELVATVLFSDVAGFTTICEQLEPEPLVRWLDSYIDVMAPIVEAHDGVLIRFVGDGILAAFGVPVPRLGEDAIATDARNAARCALAMRAAMAQLNEGWSRAGLPQAGLRIGLHTGPLVAGSLGNGTRLEYCLLGDTANVGARLEQLGKNQPDAGTDGCIVLAGGPTWERLGGLFEGVFIGVAPLRGRLRTLSVWRILAATAS